MVVTYRVHYGPLHDSTNLELCELMRYFYD